MLTCFLWPQSWTGLPSRPTCRSSDFAQKNLRNAGRRIASSEMTNFCLSLYWSQYPWNTNRQIFPVSHVSSFACSGQSNICLNRFDKYRGVFGECVASCGPKPVAAEHHHPLFLRHQQQLDTPRWAAEQPIDGPNSCWTTSRSSRWRNNLYRLDNACRGVCGCRHRQCHVCQPGFGHNTVSRLTTI